jgi:enoyl-CoA hydratase/carnithine racemase
MSSQDWAGSKPAVVVVGEGVRLLEVGSGARRNALSTPDWLRVAELARELAVDPDLRALVIRGRGNTFCSGSDIAEWSVADLAAVERAFAAMEEAFSAVEQIPAPVIAEVDGYATGGGMQLALACDLRVMAADARIGMPIVRLGIQVSTRFAQRLVESSSISAARDLLYTGRLLDAAVAGQLGLVNQVVPGDELSATVSRLAAGVAAQPRSAMQIAKRRTTRQDTDAPTAAVDWAVFPSAVTRFLDLPQSRDRRLSS